MVSFLPSESAPFGFLESLHQHVVRTAIPLNYTNWPFLFTIPLLPLAVLTYLVQFPGTRPWRIPIGVLGLGMILNAAFSYRFENVVYNAFNNGIGIAAMHLAGKYVEYAVIEGPIEDPYVARGTRSHYLAAIDLAINSRMIGLGRVDLGRGKGRGTSRGKGTGNKADQAENDNRGADGAVKLNGGATVPHRPAKEHWLPYTHNDHRSRLSATLRHLRLALSYYIGIDTLMALLWKFDGAIADPHGQPGAVQSFLESTHFVFFPRSTNPVPVPTLLVEVVVMLSLALGVWQGISWGYHSFAVIAVGSGLYEVEAWEVDIFDAPWKADSLLDMWGRRWHQLFRHHFLLLSSLILRALHLPLRPPFILPLIFFFSGTMHSLGQMSMSPLPDPTRLALFFFLSGVGCAFEATFRKFTGKKVHGPWGRVWMWSWFLVTGRWAARTWLDGGLGGSRLVPTEWDYRPGPVLVRWITRWVFDEVKG